MANATANQLSPIHLDYARSYLAAARYLDRGVNDSDLDDLEGPLYYLCGITLELTLKAVLKWATDDVSSTPKGKSERDFGHNLSALYNRLKSEDPTKHFILNAEKFTKDAWRSFLREARTRYLEGLPPELACKVPTNADIGDKGVGKLQDHVSWLNDRYADDGGRVRYVKLGLDSRFMVCEFGLRKAVVPQSIFWCCERILNDLEASLREQLRNQKRQTQQRK